MEKPGVSKENKKNLSDWLEHGDMRQWSHSLAWTVAAQWNQMVPTKSGSKLCVIQKEKKLKLAERMILWVNNISREEE